MKDSVNDYSVDDYSVNDYIEFYKERNEDPDKLLSGKFTVRLTPELHSKILQKASLENKSINSWLKEALESLVQKD